MNQSNYEEKLVDPRWQKKRFEILTRDNWTCQHCGCKTVQLEIHHTDYWGNKEPWEYPNDMLITICHNCHGEENIRFKHEAYLLKSLKLQAFLAADLLAFSTMLNTNQKFTEYIKNKIREYAKS